MGEWTPLALLALLSLIPLTIYVTWSKRPQQAAMIVVFFAALFGPEGAFIKLPLVPPLDKVSIPYLLLFIVALIKWRPRMARARLWRGPDVLILLAMVGGFVTMATNGEPLTYGSWRTVTLPGLVINDGIQLGLSELLRAGLPFMLGRALFRTRRDLVELLHFLVVAGLLQTLFIWVELRLSPQFHGWVYGYGAHSDFLQTIRWGGYRPMVFMAHGLALALFMLVSFLACLVLLERGVPTIRKWKTKRVAIYLGIVLVLCKSTGAILYALLLAPLILRFTPKAQMRAVAIMAALIAFYPALRAFDLFPSEQLVEWANGLSPERAQSMEFRFDNEELLLDKVRERLWFGWGGHGRRSVYDDEIGKDIAVADGHWIIVFGMRGLVGFLEAFGLLLWPLILLRRRWKTFAPADQRLVVGFGLIVAIVTLDLIPNGLFSTYPYMLAGALLGVLHERERRPKSWA